MEEMQEEKRRNFEFGFTAVAANATLIEDLSDWLHIVGMPWIIVAISYGIDAALDPAFNQGISKLLLASLSVVALVSFSVRAFRFIVLEEVPAKYISFEWNVRHWLTLGYGLLIVAAIAGIIWMAAVIDMWPVVLLSLIVSLYLIGRFSMVLPLIAIDEADPMVMSWKLTSEGWLWVKLLILILVVAVPVMFLLGMFTAMITVLTAMPQGIMQPLFMNFVAVIIEATAIGLAYKQIIGEDVDIENRYDV
jgi:hypothetical protein